MARPKKSTARKQVAKKKTPRKPAAKGRAKQGKELHPHQVRAQLSATLKAQTAEIKMLKNTNVRRPLPKSQGFSAWSLRYAQTPHINSWSFAKHNTSQKGIYLFKNKKNNKNYTFTFGKTPSYTA